MFFLLYIYIYIYKITIFMPPTKHQILKGEKYIIGPQNLSLIPF